MRFLSIVAIALCGAVLTGFATNASYSSPDIATSSKAGWGPHGKPLYYLMVLSNPAPGKEKEFNTWYDRIHAPYLIEEGDFVWTQRFELSPDQFAGGGTPELKTRQFMVIFAIETNDIKGALAAVNKHLALPRNVQSASLDGGSLQSVSWKALGPPTTQKDAKRLLAEEEAAGRLPKLGQGPAPGTEEHFYRDPQRANGPPPQGATPAR
jgi:hypothetical protein